MRFFVLSILSMVFKHQFIGATHEQITYFFSAMPNNAKYFSLKYNAKSSLKMPNLVLKILKWQHMFQ